MKPSQIFGALSLTWMIALAFSVANGLVDFGALSLGGFLGFGVLTGMALDLYD